MHIFVKEEVLKNTLLHKIEIMKKQDNLFCNLKNAKDVDLGYVTRLALKNCSGTKEKEVLLFRQECRTCLMFTTAKILERSPLKYPLTEALTFLNPNKVGLKGTDIEQQMTAAFGIILNANWLCASTLQEADREYKRLISDEEIIKKMKSYSRDERLDDFWMSILKRHTKMENLKQVVKMLLPLSHGNAVLERGFSINKEILVENLYEDSLVAQRVVYDAVSNSGGIDSIQIPKKILLSIRNSNARWKQALEEKKQLRSAEEKAKAEKRKAELEAKELEKKKQKLIKISQKEIASIDEAINKLKHKTI